MNLNFPKSLPPQRQFTQPGIEEIMKPKPIFDDPNYKGTKKLINKVALITGGDSGIGKAVSILYAKEGADIAIIYLNEHIDAKNTQKIIQNLGRKCILLSGDIGNEDFCNSAVKQVIQEFDHIDILVNNAAEQHPQNSIEDITSKQLERTFRTNIFGMFYMTKAVIPHLKENSVIINTSSVTAYKGNQTLIDYSSSKGAVNSFTKSLALSLASKNIRVNSVSPGPIWTPLIPSSTNEEQVSKFGSNTLLKRPGQPIEVAGAYLYLACDSSTYISGQTIHINGGEIVTN